MVVDCELHQMAYLHIIGSNEFVKTYFWSIKAMIRLVFVS